MEWRRFPRTDALGCEPHGFAGNVELCFFFFGEQTVEQTSHECFTPRDSSLTCQVTLLGLNLNFNLNLSAWNKIISVNDLSCSISHDLSHVYVLKSWLFDGMMWEKCILVQISSNSCFQESCWQLFTIKPGNECPVTENAKLYSNTSFLGCRLFSTGVLTFSSGLNMMTSSNGNIFRVTGHLCGEFTGPRWIPHTKASDAELWCFLWSAPQ